MRDDVLALTLGKREPHLEPAHDPSVGWIGGWGKEKDKWLNTSMGKLADRLEAFYGLPVLDRTGLTGMYDFYLTYNQQIRDITDAEGPNGRSFKSAAEDELGLRIIQTKAPVEILVIDSAAKPTEN